METVANLGELGIQVAGHFGLRSLPFRDVESHAFFPCEHHVAAIEDIERTLSAEGLLVCLTGGPGIGKSRLCQELVRRSGGGDNWIVVSPQDLWGSDMLSLLCRRLAGQPDGPHAPATLENAIEALSDAREAGRQKAVVIDSAELLTAEAGEGILDLIDSMPPGLIHMVLAGSANPVNGNGNGHAAGRAGAHRSVDLELALRPFCMAETAGFVGHCVAAVGGYAERVFASAAMPAIHRFTGGNPRLIAALADASMFAAYSRTAPLVRASDVDAATQYVNLPERWSGRAQRLISRLRRWRPSPEDGPAGGAICPAPLGGHEPENGVVAGQALTVCGLPSDAQPVAYDAPGLDAADPLPAGEALPEPKVEAEADLPAKRRAEKAGSKPLMLVGIRGVFDGVRAKVRPRTKVTIGRAPDCHLSVCRMPAWRKRAHGERGPAWQISRHHATITYKGDGVYVRDYSMNGTYVNGKRVRRPIRIRTPIQKTYEISLGSKKNVLLLCP